MGIKYTPLDKKTTLSLSDACNAYLDVTGKQTKTAAPQRLVNAEN